jgi:acyl carrier protein
MDNSQSDQAPDLEVGGSDGAPYQGTSLTAEAIQTWLMTYLAELLEIDIHEIDPSVSFERYGLDSSAAIGVTCDIEDWLGRELDPTLLYDYPTVTELAQHLASGR